MKSRLNCSHVIDILKRNKIFQKGSTRYDKPAEKYCYFYKKAK